MFYFWHTSLVVLFIAIAYWLGYQFGLKKKIKVFSQKKLWKVLKSTPKEKVEVAISTVSPNETSQEDWIKGYNKWQKTNQKLNDRTLK
tara:strand:+ start:159 stop:422 length:264 start_codon:yes stop_codon:yes gene_type:complete